MTLTQEQIIEIHENEVKARAILKCLTAGVNSAKIPEFEIGALAETALDCLERNHSILDEVL